MSIVVNWNEDQTVIEMRFAGKWTWGDYRQAGEEAIAMMRSAPHRVDVIVDMRYAAAAPIETDNQSIRDGLEHAPANYGITVFFGADRFTQMIFSIMQQFIPILHNRVMMVATAEDARSLITVQRAISDRRPPVAAGRAARRH